MKNTSPKLSLIVVRSTDLKASLTFYRTLGLNFIEEQHGAGPIHYSCDFGDLILELYPNKSDSGQQQNGDTTMLGFNVESLENTLVHLKELGIEPKTPPKTSDWGRWVSVLEPSGRTVQLNEVADSVS